MTAGKAIELAGKLRPNSFDSEIMHLWLTDIEKRIERDVMYTHIGVPQSEYLTSGGDESELFAPSPSSELYILYLSAMIDFYNGEGSRYNNCVIRFNSIYDEFLRYCHNKYTPCPSQGNVV